MEGGNMRFEYSGWIGKENNSKARKVGEKLCRK